MERPVAPGAWIGRPSAESLAVGAFAELDRLANRGLDDPQLDGIRTSVNRGRPLGPGPWVQRTAKRLGLEFTLRGPGRPRNESSNQ
jgi:hypothetical protein